VIYVLEALLERQIIIDRVLAVVLATGLEGEQLSIPGSAWSAARKSLLPCTRRGGDSAQREP
jgi:hypothetical protein